MYIKKIRSKLICGWCEFAVQCLSGINEVFLGFCLSFIVSCKSSAK